MTLRASSYCSLLILVLILSAPFSLVLEWGRFHQERVHVYSIPSYSSPFQNKNNKIPVSSLEPIKSDNVFTFSEDLRILNTSLPFISLSYYFSQYVSVNGECYIFLQLFEEVVVYFIFEIISYYGNKQHSIQYLSTMPQEFSPGNTSLLYTIPLPWLTLPGEYTFQLYLSYYNRTGNYYSIIFGSSQYFEVFPGPLFFWLGLFLVIGITLYLVFMEEHLIKRPRVHLYWYRKLQALLKRRVFPPLRVFLFLHNPFISEAEKDPRYSYIRCPDCRKSIVEGSAFCPYCGYHLKKFERFLK